MMIRNRCRSGSSWSASRGRDRAAGAGSSSGCPATAGRYSSAPATRSFGGRVKSLPARSGRQGTSSVLQELHTMSSQCGARTCDDADSVGNPWRCTSKLEVFKTNLEGHRRTEHYFNWHPWTAVVRPSLAIHRCHYQQHPLPVRFRTQSSHSVSILCLLP